MAESDLAFAMARQLAAWGVEAVFGVTGDDLLPFLDALARAGGIRYIGAAHETGAAFMAAAYAELSGGLGVCAASAAGSVNLLAGLAAAGLDRVPVLALTGQADRAGIGTPAKQYYDQQQAFAGFAAYTELAADAAGALRLLIRAMSRALLLGGAAHLSVPKDLWREKVRAEPGGMPAAVTGRRAAGAGDPGHAAALMRAAKRPLLLVGKAARGMAEEVRALASAWGAGVAVAQDAKGVIPDDWPEVVGGIGEAWTPALVSEADCVLLIGEAGFEQSYLPPAPIIQLHTDPARIDDRYLWDSLAGGIGELITVLLGRLAGRQTDPSWPGRIAAAHAKRMRLAAADRENEARPIHPARLMAALARTAAADAVIALDEGAFNHWFDRGFIAKSQRVLLSTKWRSMGYGLPAAIAARVRDDKKQVIALVGDGGLLMSLGELATAAKYRLPLTVVVVNNRIYGLEMDKTLAGGLEPVGLSLPAVDFARAAEAFGLQGYRVTEPGDLERVLGGAFSRGEPALVDVICADARLPMAGGG